jgi:hypothetical protein
MPMPMLMFGPDCTVGVSGDFGGGFLFFFGFFDSGVDAGTHWPLSFSILPASQRQVLPSNILPPVQIWGGGQFPSELRGLPSGQAPPGGVGQLGPTQSGAVNTAAGWQLPFSLGVVPSGQPQRLAAKISRVQQMPLMSSALPVQTHLPSAPGLEPSGQPPGGLQTPSPIDTVPSGQPLTGWQMPSPM